MAVVLGLVLRGDRLAALRPDRARGSSSRRCSTRCAPDGFIGHVVFWDQPLSLPAPRLLQRHLAPRRDDRDDPAAAARLGLADRGRRPGRRAADRHAITSGCAANRDLDGDGLLWLVQPDESGLDSSPKFDPVWGRLRHGELRLSAAGRAQPPPRLGRAADPRSRLAGALRGDDQRALGPGADRGRRAVDHPGDSSTASGTSGAASFSTRCSRAARGPPSRPGPRSRPSRCPTCPRRSAAGWSRSTCSTRSATGSTNPPPSVSAHRADASSRTAARAGSCATGAARPGSTPPGCCGSGCAGSATRPRPRLMAERLSATRAPRRACASTTTRTRARASGHATSRGPA